MLAPNSIIYPTPTIFKIIPNSSELTPVLFYIWLKTFNTFPKYENIKYSIIITPEISATTANSGFICFIIIITIVVIIPMPTIFKISILLPIN